MAGGVSALIKGLIVFKFTKEAIKPLLEGDCWTPGAVEVSVEVNDNKAIKLVLEGDCCTAGAVTVSVEVDNVSLVTVAAAVAADSFSMVTNCLCLQTCKWFLKSSLLKTVLVQYMQ